MPEVSADELARLAEALQLTLTIAARGSAATSPGEAQPPSASLVAAEPAGAEPGGGTTRTAHASAKLALLNLEKAKDHFQEQEAVGSPHCHGLKQPAVAITEIRQALRHISDANCHAQSEEKLAVKRACRAARELAVWQYLSQTKVHHLDEVADTTGSNRSRLERKMCLDTMQIAFGVSQLEIELQAQMQLSHRKVLGDLQQILARLSMFGDPLLLQNKEILRDAKFAATQLALEALDRAMEKARTLLNDEAGPEPV